MKKSKLLDLIKTFTETECQQFMDFIRSPYFNRNDELPPLWAYLEQYYPEFPDEWVQKEIVYQHLYPNEPFDGKKMGYLMNYLLKLGEEFLLIQQYRKNDLKIRHDLLEEFEKRKLTKHFQFTYNKLTKHVDTNLLEASESYLYKYRIADVYNNFEMNQRNQNHLSAASKNLDHYYLLIKLKHACEMLNRNKIFTTTIEIDFISEIEGYIERIKIENTPFLIQIFYTLYNLLKKSDDSNQFHLLLDLMQRHESKIKNEEMNDIYKHAINYSIRKMRQGFSEYYETCLNLYINGIQSKALFENDFLTSNTYTNTIRLGLILKKYDWTEEFIQTHTKHLRKNTQKDAYHYNLALLSFEKEDYSKVITQLYQMPFSETFYDLANKVLMLKTYYELDEIDPLLSLIASFTIYLKRNKKIAQPIREPATNFCNLLNQIMRRNYKKKDKLLQKIEATNPVLEKPWLLKAWREQFA